MENQGLPQEGGDPAASAPGDHPFADAHVSFAIDCSGSTKGRPLQCELLFVDRVAQLLTPERRASAKVIPWESHVERVMTGTSNLLSICSGAGTDPRGILRHPEAREAVRKSSLWFLLTDGLITSGVQRDFARMIPSAGIHGISCVTVIFGNLAKQAHTCDISVGVSVYSICPNALFLFYDTKTHEIIIMQAKGVFESLLNGAENPVIDESTTWKSFPRLSLEALSAIVIPAPKALQSDEVSLGSVVVNLNDLWSNKLSTAKVREIFGNEQNLNSLTMTATSKGPDSAEKYRSWLQRQQIHEKDPFRAQRHDQFAASEILHKVLVALENGEAGLEELQRLLRRAHIDNMKAFLASCQREVAEASERAEWVTSATAQTWENASSARALNSTRSYRTKSALPNFTKTTAFPQIGKSKLRTFGLTSSPYSGLLPEMSSNAQLDSDAQSTTSQFSWISDAESAAASQASSFVDVKTELTTPRLLRTSAWGSRSAAHDRHAQKGQFAESPATAGEAHATVPNAPNTRDALDRSRLDVEMKLNDTEQQHTPATADLALESWASLSALYTDDSLRGLLWTSSFDRGHKDFTGRCAICNSSDFTLAWLFKSSMTRSFPFLAQLSYPTIALSYGCPPGASNMLSAHICCEPCAAHCLSSGRSLHGEPVIAALPMVSYNEKNRAAYAEALSRVFFAGDPEKNAQLFLAVLLEALNAPEHTEYAYSLFKDAARWTAEDLMLAIKVPDTGADGRPTSLCGFLNQELCRPTHRLDGSAMARSALLHWPLPGFILALRALPVCGSPDNIGRDLAFMRLMLVLSESLVEARHRLGGEEAALRLRRDVLARAEDRDGVHHIPLEALRGTLLISDESYQLLDGVPEFKHVGANWGAATALFVRGLNEFLTQGRQGDADDVVTFALTEEVVECLRRTIQAANKSTPAPMV